MRIPLEKEQSKNEELLKIQFEVNQWLAAYKQVFKFRDKPYGIQFKKQDGGVAYTPSCKNDGVAGVCKKPCSGCKHRDPAPLTDEILAEHYWGIISIGGYVAFLNNRTNMVVLDFDNHQGKTAPLKDVIKFYQTCKKHRIPIYVFRSKSGNGFHIYIFFKKAIKADTAIDFVNSLLFDAGLKFSNKQANSFDRFFPNQRELTGKKLGGLIALPYGGQAREKGNGLMLDPESGFTKPYDDQTKALNDVEKISLSRVKKVVRSIFQVGVYRGGFLPENSSSAVYNAQQIISGCGFIRHCIVHASTLREPYWIIFLNIIGRCEDGTVLCHEYSMPYPGYSKEETDLKLQKMLKYPPYSCKSIMKIDDTYCKDCTLNGKNSGPIVLGTPDERLQQILKLNNEYAVVRLGSKCQIACWEFDKKYNCPKIEFIEDSQFHKFFRPKRIKENGLNTKERLSTAWFDSEFRAEYSQVGFYPNNDCPKGHLNLFLGFAVTPVPGSCNLYKKHLQNVICNGDVTVYNYLFALMARIVQDPGGKRPGVAVVLRGKQGTGKGLFMKYFGEIFGNGQHYLHITHQRQLTGRFNSHLQKAIVVFCDEGIWAGDKSAAGVLKALITEDTQLMEGKYKDPVTIDNHVNLFMASNNEWIVPAEAHDRRFFVLDVPDTYMQDAKYFGALVDQMENGGREALMWALQNFDYSGIDLRKFPKTKAHWDQLVNNMSPEEKFIYGLLHDGFFPEEKVGWPAKVKCIVLFESFVEFTKSINKRNFKNQAEFGKALKRILPKVERKNVQSNNYLKEKKYHYVFPSLEECRDQFNEYCGIEIDWEE